MGMIIPRNLGTFTLFLGIFAWILLTLSILFGRGDPSAWVIASIAAAASFAFVGAVTGLVALSRYPDKIHNWFGLLLCLSWLGYFTGKIIL